MRGVFERVEPDASPMEEVPRIAAGISTTPSMLRAMLPIWAPLGLRRLRN
jgi:hypothetical protein